MEYIFNVLAWNLIGFLILLLIGAGSKIIGECPNSDFFSPLWLYENFYVNWFGALIMCVILNIICPVWSIGFWIYKFGRFIFTVGRK